MDVFSFVILSLAACRLGSLLAREQGPYDVLDWVRWQFGVRYDELNKPYGTNTWATMILCIYCNTVWIGILFTALYLLFGMYLVWFCLPFAISAAALVVDKLW